MSALALARDVDVGALLLRAAGGRKLTRGPLRADQRVTDGTLERTIEGASTLTLTLDDSDRTFIRSGMFDRQLDMQFEGLWWRLVQVSKQGDSLSLTFEDRAVSYLRAITTPRKASRSKMTRAEFALSIVREVKANGGIPFVAPDLHAKQPIASSADTTPTPPTATAAQPTATTDQGIAADAALTVKHAPASASQRQLGQRVLAVAASVNASERAAMALIQACIQESTMQNLNYGDADSLGILQVRSSTAAGMGIDNRDPEACAHAFLTRGFWGKGSAIDLAAKNPSWPTGQVAQYTQGSAYPTAYDQWRSEAQAWVNAFGGVGAGGTVSAASVVRVLPFQFQRGGTDGSVEDSWTCLQRLASEVQWRCFMRDGQLYFVSETTLMKARPVATLAEFVGGVDVIDFDVDNGKADNEATVTARAGRMALPPGAVVELRNVGPANGRWLVKSTSRGVFDAATTVTLKRVTKPLPEPAPETTTTSSSNTGFGAADEGLGSGDGTTAPLIDRAYAAAQAMNAKRYPYVWGGGHAHVGTPDRGTGRDPGIGFDCSGSTCAILGAAGMGYTIGGPADVSGTIAAKWGEAGEGRYLTVWANDIHVWLEFKPSNAPARHFGTGDWGSATGTGGPAWQSRMHTKTGFTPRRWPGT